MTAWGWGERERWGRYACLFVYRGGDGWSGGGMKVGKGGTCRGIRDIVCLGGGGKLFKIYLYIFVVLLNVSKCCKLRP